MNSEITKVGQRYPRSKRKRIWALAAKAFWGVVLLALFVPMGVPGQQVPTPPEPGVRGMGRRSTEPNSAAARMEARMSAMRNADRQKQIVADTAHLLQLAQKLNEEVSKSDKDMLSVSVVKEAEEIEKLAKTVKDKMKNGV
ncbi:MAG TPA: hypothetical protein VFW25_15625 [Silvibacterium sp.]|nr:hypothetical protein [Silvibacterium sp.]